MRYAPLAFTIILFFILTSCSKNGFNIEKLREHIIDRPMALEALSEEDIKKAKDKAQEITAPFKLAIYFSDYQHFSYAYGTHFNTYSWKWAFEDKEKFQKYITEHNEKKTISTSFILNDAVATNVDKVTAIRYAAAQAGADKVLIVNGVFDRDFYGNGLGFTYVLLVTAFFVPGTISHGLFMINATLWDVHEPIQFFSIETEGISKQIRPKALIGKGKLMKESKANALENLKKDLIARLNNMNNSKIKQ